MAQIFSTLSRFVTSTRFRTHVFSRFYYLRKAYSLGRSLVDFRARNASRNGKRVVESNLSLDEAVRCLRTDAVAVGLRLSTDMVAGIERFARTANCTNFLVPDAFSYADVTEGYLHGQQPIALADVKDPLACTEIQQVLDDATLRSIVMRYLGYFPRHSIVRLIWSFALDIPDEERIKQYQTIEYHFDTHAMSFVYANFYILDTDRMSGAHMMFKGSHKPKPFRMLFGSCRQTSETLQSYYGSEGEIVIEGKAGEGFIQDSSCYHKALPPINRNRLMLQIRYC